MAAAPRDDGEAKEEFSPATSDEDALLDEMFTDRSATSDDNSNSIADSGDNHESSPDATGVASIHPESVATATVEIATRSRASKTLPILSTVITRDVYYEKLLHNADHAVGRTRVPWHSKSVSDLRDPSTKPTRIVAFDVGGKLFRCKESLIAKHPLKRLNQIIACGCGKVSCLDDAFFIDRNPQHFEMILDWYRTGKLVRQRNVDEEAFKDDAIYFDLYEELFSKTPAASGATEITVPWEASAGLPVRRRSVNDVEVETKSTKRVSMFATMAVPTKQVSAAPRQENTLQQSKTKDTQIQAVERTASNDDGPLRFFRRERRVLTMKSIPLVFKVRRFEQLLVESVKGRGKLMVRVCDVTGMQAVEVSEAVLFDSNSRFYLEGGRAQLEHNALFPGNHMYTFWMEEHSSSTTSVQPPAAACLDIDFKLLFTFDHSDRLTTAELTRSMSDSNTALQSLTPEKTSPSTTTTESFSPCLFLPPSQQQRHSNVDSPSRASQTVPAKVLSPVSKMKSGGKREGQPHDQSSPMRNAGAAIVRGGQQPHPRPAEGKITIYRTKELELDPASDQDTLLSLHHHKPSSERKTVEAAYQDMQPRLFP